MINLWQQIAAIADFDKNGEVDTEEFMGGVETACKGKAYADLPEAFKFFIEAQFRTIDVDGKHLTKERFPSYHNYLIFQVMDQLDLKSSAMIASAAWLIPK